jgi:hypothetical protein
MMLMAMMSCLRVLFQPSKAMMLETGFTSAATAATSALVLTPHSTLKPTANDADPPGCPKLSQPLCRPRPSAHATNSGANIREVSVPLRIRIRNVCFEVDIGISLIRLISSRSAHVRHHQVIFDIKMQMATQMTIFVSVCL